MSDSVANLTVKVDTKSVAAAIAALDKLAQTASAVEKSVTRIGREAAKPNAGTKPVADDAKKTEGALAKLEKRLESATREYEKVTRQINKHMLSGKMAEDTLGRLNRVYAEYNRVVSKSSSTTLEIDRATRLFTNSTRQITNSLKDVVGAEKERAAALGKSKKESEELQKSLMRSSRKVIFQTGEYQNLIDRLVEKGTVFEKGKSKGTSRAQEFAAFYGAQQAAAERALEKEQKALDKAQAAREKALESATREYEKVTRQINKHMLGGKMAEDTLDRLNRVYAEYNRVVSKSSSTTLEIDHATRLFTNSTRQITNSLKDVVGAEKERAAALGKSKKESEELQKSLMRSSRKISFQTGGYQSLVDRLVEKGTVVEKGKSKGTSRAQEFAAFYGAQQAAAERALEKEQKALDKAQAAREKRLESATREYEKVTRQINKHMLSGKMAEDTLGRLNRVYAEYNRVVSKSSSTTLEIDHATRLFTNSTRQITNSLKDVVGAEKERAAALNKSKKESEELQKSLMRSSRKISFQTGGYQSLIDRLVEKGTVVEKGKSKGTSRAQEFAAFYGAQQAAAERALEKEQKALDKAQAAREKALESSARRYENLRNAINQTTMAEDARRETLRRGEAAMNQYNKALNDTRISTTQLNREKTQFDNTFKGLEGSIATTTRLLRQQRKEEKSNANDQEKQRNKDLADAKRHASNLASVEGAIQRARTAVSGISLRAGRQTPMEQAFRIDADAQRALSRYTAVLDQYGARSIEARRASGEFNRTLQGLSNEIARTGGLLTRVSDNARVFSAAFGAANASLGGFSRVLFNTLPAVQALLGAFALREITQSIMEFERFTNTLKTVSGSTGEFNRNLGFLFAEAERIGFAVGEVGNSFARLSLAMKGAGFSADESKNSFSLLAEASRNFGLSSADTMGVIRALEQSMSKGKFMAEEVRLQLGDRLPIAMAALERAVTKVDGKQADLNKRFEEGSLDVKRYGLEFIRQINAMSGGAEALSRTQNSVAAALGRLNNELVLVTTTFGEGGFTNAVIIATQNFIAFLKTLREVGVISAAGAAMEALAKQTALLTAAFTGLVAALSVGLVAKIARFAFALTPIRLAAAAIGALTAAAVALTGAFNAPQRALNNLTAAGNDFNRAFEKSKGASEEFRTAMTTTNTATRSATTEIEKKIDVLRKLGLSEIEVTRIAGEETLKRMALAEKEMEQQLKERQGALGVLRQSALEENTVVKKMMADFATAERMIARNARASQGVLPMMTAPINTAKQTVDAYKNIMGVVRDYIGTTIDEQTALKRLEAEREKHPILVDAARTAILENSSALEKETKALKDNLDRLKENRREREAVAQMAAQPEIVQANIRLEEMGGSTALRDTSGAKKMLDTFNESLKQFQEKYGDNKFTSQMKDVEKVVLAAGQKLEWFGVTTKMTSNEAILALASNEAFAASFSELTQSVSQFAAEIDRARNPLREYTKGLEIEIAQNDRLIEASKRGADAFREAEIQNRIAAAARALSTKDNIEYEKAVEAITPAIRKLADQEAQLAAFRNQDTSVPKATETLGKYLATLEAQIRDQGKIAAAYRVSTQAGEDAELQLKAETEAIRLGAKTEVEREKIKKRILDLMRKEAAGAKEIDAAKDINVRRDEIALLEKERSLLGENVSLREQELAALRARQQAQGRSEEDIRAAEADARDIVRRRQDIDYYKNSYEELGRIGERAFEQVGDAITEAFSKGEMRALRFGDIVRGVMSSIIQSIIRLGIINPILNSLFSGTMRPTLGAGLSVLGAGGAVAGAAGGGGGGLFDLLGLSSLLPKEGILSSLGISGPGGLLSTSIINPGASIPVSYADLGGLTVMQPGAGGLTFGGLLGGFGMGAGVGGLLASLTGGNAMGGSIGGALGGGGAAALAAIPAIAGLLGPLAPFAPILGGLLGGGLGGLFGPGESSRGFGYALRGQNGGLAMTDVFYNEQGRAQFEEAQASIAALNAYMSQRGISVSGARAVGGNRFGMGNLGYGEAASFSEALGSLQFTATANEELNRALSSRSFAGVEKLQQFVEGFIGLQETIKSLTADPVPEFKQQMDALVDSFAQAVAKAREYGVAEEELIAARDKQIAKLEEQRFASVREMALGLEVRRLMAEGMEQEAQRIELAFNTQKEIEAFSASLDALGITAAEKSRLLVELERTQATERASAIRRSNQSILDYLDSLRVETSAGTSPISRLTSAQEIFNRDLALAQSGDQGALSRITESAGNLLRTGEEYYASSAGYQNIRGSVVASLEALAARTPSANLMDISGVGALGDLTSLRQEASLNEIAQYNKQFDDKLAELLPIATAIQSAVEKSAESTAPFVDYVFRDLGSSGEGGGGGFAMGGVFRNGRVTAFANGGIPDLVNSPTLAPMALFGEAGPEAIMPLRRLPNGRLGVETSGGGDGAVVAELRAVRGAIQSLEQTISESENSGEMVEAFAELRIQIGGLKEELRTNRLRAQ